jgi:DNA polymerase IV (DinB-like DNA polymerase)
MKDEVGKKTSITFSVGVGPNKLIAKIACDVKKPDGLTVVKPEEVTDFLPPLPVDRLLGVGHKIAAKMEGMGIRTIGDLAIFNVQRLVEVFGKNLGVYFHNAANGIDNRPIQETGDAESISRIGTLKENSRELSVIVEKADKLAEDVHGELLQRKNAFRQIGVIAIMTDLSVRSRSQTLEQPKRDLQTIKRAVRELFEKLLSDSDLEVRRVGVRISQLTREETSQQQLTSFFAKQ